MPLLTTTTYQNNTNNGYTDGNKGKQLVQAYLCKLMPVLPLVLLLPPSSAAASCCCCCCSGVGASRAGNAEGAPRNSLHTHAEDTHKNKICLEKNCDDGCHQRAASSLHMHTKDYIMDQQQLKPRNTFEKYAAAVLAPARQAGQRVRLGTACSIQKAETIILGCKAISTSRNPSNTFQHPGIPLCQHLTISHHTTPCYDI
jgi:hypothetical protein